MFNLYSSPYIIRDRLEDAMGWAYSRHLELRSAYKLLVERLETKAPHKLEWEGNIKMDNEEIGREGADWIPLAQGKVYWRDIWIR
jgi:hypothetical protein